MYIVIFALAIFLLILIPFAPTVILLKIRIFRWLGWNGAFNLLEKHFDRWVLFARVALLAIAVFLLYIGWEDFRP